MFSLFSDEAQYSDREVHFHGIFTSYDKAARVFQTLIQKEIKDSCNLYKSNTPWNTYPGWVFGCSSYFLCECEIDEQIVNSKLCSPDKYNLHFEHKYIVLNPHYNKPEYAHIYAKEDFLNDEEYLELMVAPPYMLK